MFLFRLREKDSMKFLIALISLIVYLCLTILGISLAFKASIILGVIVLLAVPSGFILGLFIIFGRHDVCSQIASWLHLPF